MTLVFNARSSPDVVFAVTAHSKNGLGIVETRFNEQHLFLHVLETSEIGCATPVTMRGD